ncbi:MAG: hypothetical protein M3N23_04535 [Pseudomonadota bacterium]|nr:hypothetical protein [Pseudomonadota bacterium]
MTTDAYPQTRSIVGARAAIHTAEKKRGFYSVKNHPSAFLLRPMGIPARLLAAMLPDKEPKVPHHRQLKQKLSMEYQNSA